MAYQFGECFGPKHPYSDDCKHRMRVARVQMINKYPFFGIVATKLQLVEDNVRCQTMATDGKHLFYNVHFVMGIPGNEVEQRLEYETKLREAFPDITDDQVSEALNGLNGLEQERHT